MAARCPTPGAGVKGTASRRASPGPDGLPLTPAAGARREPAMTDHHHPDPPRDDAPTPRQLRYLRELAMRVGETFATPRTKREASQAIRRLESRGRGDRHQAARDRREIHDALRGSDRDASRVRAHETTGYGATARWA